MAEGTITLGRAKRSTAGNRMRELLEKAHQQDDDDLFKEEEDDEEFAEPTEIRDVFLDEFADTDDEVEDEEAEEREIRKEERRKAKGKGRAVFDPLAGQPKLKKAKTARLTTGASGSSPSTSAAQAEALSLLDPSIDPSTMAPSTLVLALRKKRREAKRQQRSEVRRSNLRASTLKTEAEIAERENQQREAVKSSRKGRKAMHEGGEARGVRNLSQAELIAEALEEEERNKEELRKWLRREEERRELRRVGRKRVRGPRWTWISRTVGKVVEVVENEGHLETREVENGTTQTAQMPAGSTQEAKAADDRPTDGLTTEAGPTSTPAAGAASTLPSGDPVNTEESSGQERADNETVAVHPKTPPTAVLQTDQKAHTSRSTEIEKLASPALQPEQAGGTNATDPNDAKEAISVDQSTTVSGPIAEVQSTMATSAPPPPVQSGKPMLQTTSTPNQPAPAEPPSQYTRNYLVLSQVPGGLPAELALVLGDHVAWDQVKYIPARNRPINRRPPICPFTGKPARYRHPATMIPYADVRGFQEIEAMLRNRYVWSEGGFWIGGEEDLAAEGAEEIEGWREAMHGGWMAGFPIPPTAETQEALGDHVSASEAFVEVSEEVGPVKKGKKKNTKANMAQPTKGKKKRR